MSVPVDVPAWQERWKGGAPGTPLTLMRKRVDLPLDQLLERLPRRQWSGKRGVRSMARKKNLGMFSAAASE